MIAALVTVLMSVVLAAPFGRAEVAAVGSTDTELTLDVRVQVLAAADVVVARPYDQDGAPLGAAVPLSNLESDRWGALLVLPRRSGVKIGFEILSGAIEERSEVRSLIELGVDPAVFRDPVAPSAGPERRDRSTAPWAWLALVTGAAALLLGGWALSSRRRVDTTAPREHNSSGIPDNLEDADRQARRGD